MKVRALSNRVRSDLKPLGERVLKSRRGSKDNLQCHMNLLLETSPGPKIQELRPERMN